MKKNEFVFQCGYCAFWFFYVPLPGEFFSHCFIRGETSLDCIDLINGVSPAVKKYGNEGERCEKFCAGMSPCSPTNDNPFMTGTIREMGELELKAKLLGVRGKAD